MCKINGKKLKEIRTNAGMTQKDLAKLLNVSEASIGYYENGKTNPTDENVDKLCMLLKINKDDIEIHDIGYNVLNGAGKITERVRRQKGFKRYTTPLDTENFIMSKCTKTESEELNEVESEIKYSRKFANKTYLVVDPTLIHIPSWQRDTDMTKVREIADNYSEEKFEPIKVYLKNGKLYVADGAHRLLAMILRGEYKILVELISCEEEKAREMFLSQQIGRKPMTTSGMYRAAIKNNIEEYVTFKNFMKEHRVQITVEDEKINEALGEIRPSRQILRQINKKQELSSNVFNLIFNLDWCGSTSNSPYTQRIISVLMKLYSVYGKEKVEKELMKKCKGVVYFDSKVSPIKSNAELYDSLSSKIREISK